jgi:hypothetical protein
VASLVGAQRPRWCARDDPHEQALCEVYEFLLCAPGGGRGAAGGASVRVALYARVSRARQEERGTVASQLELLREAAPKEGQRVVEDFVDEGYSGARLDRPALDRLRDAAQAGAFACVVCLAADRLARSYAYQVLILEELEHFGVEVRFLECPRPRTTRRPRCWCRCRG